MEMSSEPTALAASVLDVLATSWVAVDRARPNISTLELMGDLALLVGADDLHAEVTAVYEGLRDSAFTAGVVTNIDPDVLVTNARRRRTVEGLDERRPVYDEARVAGTVKAAAAERHLALALEGRWVEAYDQSDDPRYVEDVGAVQALYGRVDEAEADIRRRVARERFGGPMTVLTVEVARRGDVDRAKAFMAELEGVNGFSVLQACLGWVGREPWGGYPLPDW